MRSEQKRRKCLHKLLSRSLCTVLERWSFLVPRTLWFGRGARSTKLFYTTKSTSDKRPTRPTATCINTEHCFWLASLKCPRLGVLFAKFSYVHQLGRQARSAYCRMNSEHYSLSACPVQHCLQLPEYAWWPLQCPLSIGAAVTRVCRNLIRLGEV